MEIAFVVLLVIVVQLLLSFVQLKDSVEYCWKREYVFSHATPAGFNFCLLLYCSVVWSASCQFTFFLHYPAGRKWNSKYSRAPHRYWSPLEVWARRLSATGMKELWATGPSWGLDRCWCWQIERVIIQSLGDELVLVLAGSPGSRITPNHTSINHAHISWHSLKTAPLSKRDERVVIMKECHQWPQEQCIQLREQERHVLCWHSRSLSPTVNCCSYLIFVEAFHVYFRM